MHQMLHILLYFSRQRYCCFTFALATALLLHYSPSRDSAFIALVSFSRQRFFLKTGSLVVRDSAFYLKTGSTGFSRQRFSLYKESKTGSVANDPRASLPLLDRTKALSRMTRELSAVARGNRKPVFLPPLLTFEGVVANRKASFAFLIERKALPRT